VRTLRKITIVGTLILVLALLASISTIQPALSKPAQKISATVTLNFPTVTQPERTIDTNGDIRQVFGVKKTFVVDITLDEQFNGETTFTGGAILVLDFTTNFKTGDIVYHNASVVWTFDDGSFNGVMQARQRFDPSSSSVIYEESLVLQGSGSFKGCTLKLSQTNNQPYTGLLMVPASAD
jgi:hypothetical protein